MGDRKRSYFGQAALTLLKSSRAKAPSCHGAAARSAGLPIARTRAGRRRLAAVCILMLSACGRPTEAPPPASAAPAPAAPRASSAAQPATHAPSDDRRPDVLLVVIDTLRADRTGVLQDPARDNTPALTALGARGLTFRQAVAPAAWTLPSMAALMAGHEVAESRRSAFPDEPALAERFAAGGWSTAALVANPLLAAENGFARGFQRYEVAPASVASLSADIHELRAWNARSLADRALALLAAEPADAPVFLYLHLMDAHVPYDSQHDALAAPEPGWSDPAAPMGAWTEPLAEAQARRLSGWRLAYDGGVRFADAALGTLLARLPDARARPCLVAVTADHGEGLFTHAREPDSPEIEGLLGAGYGDHGEQLHEECLRIPLWLAGPGVPAGLDERRPVPSCLLGPTLLELAGLAAHGRGLPLAAADPVPGVIFGVGTRGWCARTATHKLIEPFPERRAHAGVGQRLFAVDAGAIAPEREDLSAAEPDTFRELAAACAAWRAATAAAQPEAPDPATDERLRALGYIR